jgi:hypothetical protein
MTFGNSNPTSSSSVSASKPLAVFMRSEQPRALNFYLSFTHELALLRVDTDLATVLKQNEGGRGYWN